MEIKKTHQVRSVAFHGHQHEKTNTGSAAYRFNCMYDHEKYDCEVQCFRVGVDKNKNFFIERGSDEEMKPFFTANVPKHGLQVEPEYDLDLEDGQSFAYRFKLTDKDTKEERYVTEDNVDFSGCTLVTRKGTSVLNQGPMYLAMPDTFAPGYVFAGFHEPNTSEVVPLSQEDRNAIGAKVRKSVRTFANSQGGTMAGLIAKLPEIREAGNKRLITTPLMGGDGVSPFKYWPQNNFLTASYIGNRNEWAKLQTEAFRLGMSTVDDGTFTSEGLQGIRFQRAIKWMDTEERPPEYYYFRMSGINDDSLGLGVVPENLENLNNKLVNFPFDIVKNSDGTHSFKENKDYDPEKPSTLQVFDDSMVSDAQRNDKTHVITTYDKTVHNDNKLGINTHDDTVQPYSFDIPDPYEVMKNIKNLDEVNKSRSEKIDINSPRGTMFIGSLSGIKIAPKTEGGFVCWNAYTDMVKYNYFPTNYDTALLSEIKDPAQRALEMDKQRRGSFEIRDIACQVARYRTRNVRNLIEEYTAKNIGKISDNPKEAYEQVEFKLNSQDTDLKKTTLPEDIRMPEEAITNVIENNYYLRPKKDDYNEAVIESLMDLPLDSIEFAPEVQGALSSPYISKRSPDRDHITETRYEAMHDKTYNVPKEYAKTYNKVNDIFTKDIKSFADKVLKQVDANSDEKLFDKDGNMTEYGQYIIPLVGQDIARHAVTMALAPKTPHKHLANGEMAYDYNYMTDNATLLSMDVNGDCQADEANQLVNRLQKGVQKVANNQKEIDFVAKSINERFAGTNANSLKLAEAMVNWSGLGLDWRYDAAKDIADMDSVRSGAQHIDNAWKNLEEFYSDMSYVIDKENPNSYKVAEMTDVGPTIDGNRPTENGVSIIYNDSNKAVGALIDFAGITTEANYSFFFDGITDMLSRSFSTGEKKTGDKDSDRVDHLESKLYEFSTKPLDYKRNSYTFASNHDKPRMVHCLSMDMDLFHADLKDPGFYNQRATAYKILEAKSDDSELSPYDRNVIAGSENGEYFDNVSPKAIANADLLRGAYGRVNEADKNNAMAAIDKEPISYEEKEHRKNEARDFYDKRFRTFSKAIAKVAKGEYYKTEQEAHNITVPDSLKKVNEKDGFGTKSVPDAFDIVYDQLKQDKDFGKYFDEKDELKLRNRVDSEATKVGRAKTRIIMRYITALSGNPTLYAGDELGMTGYEDPCQNTYLQNRNPLDWSMVEEGSDNYRKDIAEYRKSLLDISRARKDDDMNRMEGLNNGTLYKLDRQHGHNGLDCSAIISHAANGAMNISLFNPNGLSNRHDVPVENLKPTDMTLDKIVLKTAKNYITLDKDTEFRNMNPEDKNIYKVYVEGDSYVIKRKVDDNNGAPIKLDAKTAPDGVMMLYHIPKDIETSRLSLIEKKKEAREYFNKQYNIPQANGYKGGKPETVKGTNVDITSK